jgi:hypothetical protein
MRPVHGEWEIYDRAGHRGGRRTLRAFRLPLGAMRDRTKEQHSRRWRWFALICGIVVLWLLYSMLR